MTDGIIGLGSNEKSLLTQLKSTRVVSHDVLGICLGAKTYKRNGLFGLVQHNDLAGYVTFGNSYREKFNELVWTKIVRAGRR